MISVLTAMRCIIKQTVSRFSPRGVVFSIFFGLFPLLTMAQQVAVVNEKTLKPDSSVLALKIRGRVDSAAKLKFSDAGRGIAAKVKEASGSVESAGNSLKGAANSRFQRVSVIEKGLSSLKIKPITGDLTFENSSRYHPVIPAYNNPFLAAITGNRKYANVFSVTGQLNAWGLPLNINYSTDQASSMGSRYGQNSLFKFDFNQGQLKNLLRSDLLKYKELRRDVFGGLDLTGYTRKTLTEKIVNRNVYENLPAKVSLARYLDDPVVVSRLLLMDKEKIRRQLLDDVSRRRDSIRGKLADISGQAADDSGKEMLSNTLNDRSRWKTASLKNISENKQITDYFADPLNIGQIKNMNEAQLAAKINSYTEAENVSAYPDLSYIKALLPVDSIDINGIVRRSLTVRDSIGKSVINHTAREILLSSRQTDKIDLADIINKQASRPVVAARSMALNESTLAYSPGSTFDPKKVLPEITPKQADSLASTIISIRDELENHGVDVRQMLKVEQLMQDRNFNTSELGGSFMENKPSNGIQSLFSRVDDFKLGSYGNKVPGSVQSRELFTSGTHLTYRAGRTPLTFGYGTVNDVSSFKDAGFQNSIYNQARSITYIGADLMKPGAGNLKISLVSSFNKDFHNSLYATPSISSNNVALTISKGLKLGNLGNVGLDVSKTTTLYDNQLHHSNEAVLDKKSGLSSNLSNNLFSALSFGFRHQLTVKELDASDNFYFNYAGMGYQNPANNGFGGARMKFGGSLKKSFYDKKLTFIFRTDLSNMPISYTSGDRWETRQFQLDSRYQVSRKFQLSFKYITNGTDKKIDNVISPVYGFQKIQIDGNASFKIGKYFSVSHFTIGKQDFSNMNAMQGAGNLLMLNYTQTLLLHKNTLTASAFYNKELASYHLIGDLFNSDVTYQYTLFGKIGMSSGITYLENTGIVRQSGIRQGFQVFAGSHFDLDSYVDLRKNMIRSLYPDLYPLCRAELSLRYHFKI
ncbi:hypothetical protein AAFN85_13810 [Mucilaginibacter sp. CAU 1740]|uniref:hypothetical protein n=1 Tax=Mucilaginibacter sp. CAU 1740 TaxID=3140365 RepID=UPI00325B12DD